MLLSLVPECAPVPTPRLLTRVVSVVTERKVCCHYLPEILLEPACVLHLAPPYGASNRPSSERRKRSLTNPFASARVLQSREQRAPSRERESGMGSTCSTCLTEDECEKVHDALRASARRRWSTVRHSILNGHLPLEIDLDIPSDAGSRSHSPRRLALLPPAPQRKPSFYDVVRLISSIPDSPASFNLSVSGQNSPTGRGSLVSALGCAPGPHTRQPARKNRSPPGGTAHATPQVVQPPEDHRRAAARRQGEPLARPAPRAEAKDPPDEPLQQRTQRGGAVLRRCGGAWGDPRKLAAGSGVRAGFRALPHHRDRRGRVLEVVGVLGVVRRGPGKSGSQRRQHIEYS